MRFDYTAVGHVTIDVLSDGTLQPGGAAFYSALQASRLGLRTLILTQGVRSEIESLLEPYGGELALRVLPAPATTTLATTGAGAARRQRVLAWAGPMEAPVTVETAILHLAPVARELAQGSRPQSAFVGLTPQGLARSWSARDDEIRSTPPERSATLLAGRLDAVVISELERSSCASLIATARRGGAVVAITAGARPSTILLPDGEANILEVPELAEPRDDLGAGDVFAAAFFVALAEGSPPLRAGRFATAAAAVRMLGLGPGSIGDRAQIAGRLADTAPTPQPRAAPPAQPLSRRERDR